MKNSNKARLCSALVILALLLMLVPACTIPVTIVEPEPESGELSAQGGAVSGRQIYKFLRVINTFENQGTTAMTGSSFDVDVTGAISLDADSGSNFNTSSGDLTFEAETGSITLKGDEADASAVHIDANETVTSGLNIDVGSVSGLTIDGGLTDIGGGTGGTADGDNDLLVAGDLEVDNTLDVDGDIDLDGTGLDVDITGTISLDADAASNINVAGAGVDLTLESEAGSVVIKGDEAVATAVTIDANDAVTTGVTIQVGSVSGLVVTGGLTDIGGGTGGTADGDNDLLVAGDLEVDNTLDVDGDIDLDGTGLDVDITGTISLDADAASNINVAGAGVDLTLESEAGSVVIKGDEAVATAVTIDANDAVTTGVTINVGSVSGLVINGGLTDIGGGSGALADGDNDLLVAGDLEVDTGLRVDGNADLNGTLDVTGAGTFAGDVTIDDTFNIDDTAYTSSGTQTLTPTASFYLMNPGGQLTLTLGTTDTGDWLVIYNSSANNINIVDTNLLSSDGSAIDLGQYDILGLIFNGAEWVEAFKSANS